MVTGGIPIQQMLQKPVCACFPVNTPPVHHVSRHPHARVIVQPSTCRQVISEAIHAGQPGVTLTNVFG